MTAHAQRAHATWSASSTARNWACPGALTLSENLPETTNPAADWGTCAHEIAELCLRDGGDAAQFIGTVRKGKEHEYEVDEEMAETAQVYVDYVRSGVADGATLWIEEKFSLSPLKPPFEAGGTADAVLHFPESRSLEVVDLKAGRGVIVEVENNKQLRTYALGALLRHDDLPVDSVTVTIVQPRAPHKSGRTRSETFSAIDLMEWTAELLAAMRRANDAKFNRPTMHSVVWEREYLSAGQHCQFCKAAGLCPKLRQKALDEARVWFDDLDQPRQNSPRDLDPGELAKVLDMADMIGEWLNAVRKYATSLAESGVEIPNYQLAEKIGNRKWTASEAQIIATLDAEGVDPYAPRKVVSPAQAEKALGAKRKALIVDMVERPVTGRNLVRADKSSRPAAKPTADMFEAL